MKELLGSQVKERVLLCLGLRGGMSGRRLARLIKKSPTPVFKALHQLQRGGAIKKFGPPYFYALARDYPYYDELIRMIHKRAGKNPPYLPRISEERRVDPLAVYEIANAMGRGPSMMRFSAALRRRFA